MDAQYFPFYIILSNYVWSILFYRNEHHNVRQIRFHVCIKIHRCKKRVCRRKTIFGQPNISYIIHALFNSNYNKTIKETLKSGMRRFNDQFKIQFFNLRNSSWYTRNVSDGSNIPQTKIIQRQTFSSKFIRREDRGATSVCIDSH